MRSHSLGPKRQRGVSFIMLMVYFAMAGALALLGMKVVPAYLDYLTVKKIFASMSNSEEVRSGTVQEIRKSFDRRATIDYQKSVTMDDLEITKEGNETVVSATWQAKIPLFIGWTLLIDFTASTSEK
ncbi:MAG: DUF4845 domain-containing protein [Betaproteobacteria bacterium]|nr:DUF4845 domain-containing protein [Betaproteobacteria bacterium]